MKKRLIALAMPLALVASPVGAEQVRGIGSAPISKDLDSVRASARTAARQNAILNMLKIAIGADRLGDVTPAQIASMASQISEAMIVNQKSSSDGKNFIVELDTDIDAAWFRELLDNEGILSSSQLAMGDNQLIFVMLDQNSGMARNFSTPQEVSVEYDRRTGGSFSDRSVEAAASKDASGSTSRSASGYRVNAAGASGVSTRNGSAADRYRGSAAGAHSSNASTAEMHSSSYASKANVQAEVHDDVRYREHIVYQRPPQNSPVGHVLAALTRDLGRYGVAMADPDQALSSFFAGEPPRFETLSKSERFTPFLASLAQRDAPFFMGGTMTVEYGGRDPATGNETCSGQLNARVYATSNSRLIAPGAEGASAMGRTPGDCEAALAKTLAQKVAGQIGPAVQKHWRNIARANVGHDSQQLADYTLVLRAAGLDMKMQADLDDALRATPGVESQSVVSQKSNEMHFTVRYAGTAPLQFALYQKLRGLPAFANMQSTVNGRSILLCLTACGPAQ
ncbi:hypothetical protein [Sphingopyxis witflariensis]|uniref:Flagellar assembly protein T N-terminal domain-containing protein n=1 Tax=Sphingopyxis witflariensis TaxID=173675 RepID=A0A246JDA0_9SPHN|nr:hypothetical protein [Sphingopyxis witflariensis]OWQ90554.1 hypothetical protein CDQ91_20355 [Sphingopyxis witflariensis]